MKYFALFLIVVLASCSKEPSISELQKQEFEQITREYQNKYIDGSENCEYILNSIDENIHMSESQFGLPNVTISYEQLVQFCPHLPKKEVINSITEQRLLTPSLGYDYVSQLYLRKSVGDTVRETSSRIWAKNDEVWKIIQMNSSLNKACDNQ